MQTTSRKGRHFVTYVQLGIVVVTKRRSSRACMGSPKPEQESIKGTHAQETSAYQRRATTQHAAQGSNPPNQGAMKLGILMMTRYDSLELTGGSSSHVLVEFFRQHYCRDRALADLRRLDLGGNRDIASFKPAVPKMHTN